MPISPHGLTFLKKQQLVCLSNVYKEAIISYCIFNPPESKYGPNLIYLIFIWKIKDYYFFSVETR